MTDLSKTAGLSKKLLAAQEELLALRAAIRARKNARSTTFHGDQPARSAGLSADHRGHLAVPEEQTAAAVAALPAHLGWGNARISAIYRAAQEREQKQRQSGQKLVDLISFIPSETRPAEKAQSPVKSAVIKVYPDLALAMLREKLAASGRVWLLLRHLDQPGCGWIDERFAREQLTKGTSPLRICGRRQLRNLWAQGENVFWERQDGRIWLRSEAKVAFALGVRRLKAKPVEIPLPALRGSIGTVRATLFATFHSSRPADRPIARDTLATISQVRPRTQRDYDRRAGTSREHHYAIGPRLDSIDAQELAWQKGGAAFIWQDQDRSTTGTNQPCLAWQLPNSYKGPFDQGCRGRQKRINRQLADLFEKGKMGNGQSVVDSKKKRFFGSAKSAAAIVSRQPGIVYWPAPREGIWHTLGLAKDCPRRSCDRS